MGSVVISSDEHAREDATLIYPHPGSDEINIVCGDRPISGTVNFHNLRGVNCGISPLIEGKANVSSIPPGLYLLEIRQNEKTYFARWSKF